VIKVLEKKVKDTEGVEHITLFFMLWDHLLLLFRNMQLLP
jgi:hypothetical protein